MQYTIDAKEKKLGRVASEAAKLLLGKDTPAFAKNIVSANTVTIINAAQLSISDAKKEMSGFKYFSGFAGGLRTETLGNAIDKKGIDEVVRKVVLGMLPKNKLRSKIITHLTITA